MKIVLFIILILMLFRPGSASADRFSELTSDGPGVTMVSEIEGLSSVTGVLDLDPQHLLALGTGVLLGATVIG